MVVVSPVGAGIVGVALLPVGETEPDPAALTALTLTVYSSPFVNPVIVNVVSVLPVDRKPDPTPQQRSYIHSE